jgi:hypothetical protein
VTAASARLHLALGRRHRIGVPSRSAGPTPPNGGLDRRRRSERGRCGRARRLRPGHGSGRGRRGRPSAGQFDSLGPGSLGQPRRRGLVPGGAVLLTPTVNGTRLARIRSRSGRQVLYIGHSIVRNAAPLSRQRSYSAGSMDSATSPAALPRMNTSIARRGPRSAMACSIGRRLGTWSARLAVNGVGEPSAGEPHARFDGRELDTEQPDHGHRSGTASTEPQEHQGIGAYHQAPPPTQLPTLPGWRYRRRRGGKGPGRGRRCWWPSCASSPETCPTSPAIDARPARN